MTAHTCAVSDPDNCYRCDLNLAEYERYTAAPTGVIWTRTREDHDYWLSRIVDVPGTPEASTSAVLARIHQYIESEGEVCLPCTTDLPCTPIQIVVHDPYPSCPRDLGLGDCSCLLPSSQPACVLVDRVGVSVDSQLDNNT